MLGDWFGIWLAFAMGLPLPGVGYGFTRFTDGLIWIGGFFFLVATFLTGARGFAALEGICEEALTATGIRFGFIGCLEAGVLGLDFIALAIAYP